VCELDGPMPILNTSATRMLIVALFAGFPASAAVLTRYVG
jgi:hypothetical protein